MNMNLVITTEACSRVVVTVDDAPDLFAAWKTWKEMQEECIAGPHHWNRVLEEAGCYLDNNEHDGEEVTDVSEGENSEEPDPSVTFTPSELAAVLNALRRLRTCPTVLTRADYYDKEPLSDEQLDAMYTRLLDKLN